MADLQKTVEIVFGAVNKTGTTFSKLEKDLNSLTQPAADVTTSLLKLEAALATIATTALVFATNKAVDFEAALTGLKKVLGDEESQLDSAIVKIKDLSVSYGESATSVTDSVTAFKQASFDLEGSLLLTEQALTAVKIAELDAEEASNLLVAAIKGFGLSAEDSVRILDVWNEASNRYATNAGEIAIATSQISGIAKVAGLTLEETTALLIPIIEVFRSGSESANALKSGIGSLSDPTKKVKTVMSELGVSLKTSDGELRNVKDIIVDLAEKWDTLSDAQKANTATVIFGKEQAGRMIQVFENYNTVTNATDTLLKAAGSSQKELASVMGTTQTSLDRLSAAFDLAGIAIGDEFLKGTDGAAEGLSEILIVLEEAIKAGKLAPIFDLLSSELEGFGESAFGVAEALREVFKNGSLDFNGFISAFRDLQSELSTGFDKIFGEGLDLTKADDLQQFLQKIVDLFATFTAATAGVVESMQPIFEAIGEIVTETAEVGNESAKSAGNILGVLTILQEAGLAFAGFVVYIKETGVSVKTTFEQIGLGASVIFNTMQAVFDSFAGVVAQGISTLNAGLALVTFGETSAEFQATADKWDNIAKATAINFQKNMNEAGEAFGALVLSSDKASKEMEADTTGFSDHVKTLTKAVETNLDNLPKRVSNSVIEANREAETSLELAKINSETRIAEAQAESAATQKTIEETSKSARVAIEANAKLNVEQIKANVEKVKAITETISGIISSTGSNIVSLTDQLKGTNRKEFATIIEALRKEQRIRQESAEKANALAQVEIELARAKLKKMKEGDALVTINGDGLEPELEAFMWKIVEKIKVRVAQDQSEFLLGYGG